MAPTDAEALEPFRRYLEVLARVHLDARLRGKLDPADLVQQTLLLACAALPEVRARSPEALAAWLRKILARTLADTVKHYHRDRRDVNLECSLEADLDRSSSGLAWRCSRRAAVPTVVIPGSSWGATAASAAASASASSRGVARTGTSPLPMASAVSASVTVTRTVARSPTAKGLIR